MKLSPAIFLLFALAVLAPVEQGVAQDQTEAKIRLMAEALAARDRGELATAKEKFEALLVIVPNDLSVRRLIADIDQRIAAQQAASLAPSSPLAESATVPSVASAPPTEKGSASMPPLQEENVAPVEPATRSSAPHDPVMPVVMDEKPPGLPGNAPVVEKDPYAEVSARISTAAAALAQSETMRLERMGAYLEAQRELARLYARDGNYSAAVRTLNAALGILQTPVNELRAERDQYARQEQAARRGPRVRIRR